MLKTELALCQVLIYSWLPPLEICIIPVEYVTAAVTVPNTYLIVNHLHIADSIAVRVDDSPETLHFIRIGSPKGFDESKRKQPV